VVFTNNDDGLGYRRRPGMPPAAGRALVDARAEVPMRRRELAESGGAPVFAGGGHRAGGNPALTASRCATPPESEQRFDATSWPCRTAGTRRCT
jgi:hypothetical protein